MDMNDVRIELFQSPYGIHIRIGFRKRSGLVEATNMGAVRLPNTAELSKNGVVGRILVKLQGEGYPVFFAKACQIPKS